MAALTIQSVPEKLIARLQDRAAIHGRSVEEEALECLESALNVRPSSPADVEREIEDVRRFRNSLGSIYLTEEELQRAKREGRP